MAPTVSLEQLAYATRLMNVAQPARARRCCCATGSWRRTRPGPAGARAAAGCGAQAGGADRRGADAATCGCAGRPWPPWQELRAAHEAGAFALSRAERAGSSGSPWRGPVGAESRHQLACAPVGRAPNGRPGASFPLHRDHGPDALHWGQMAHWRGVDMRSMEEEARQPWGRTAAWRVVAMCASVSDGLESAGSRARPCSRPRSPGVGGAPRAGSFSGSPVPHV